MAVIYFGFHAWLSRNHLYDQKGRPLFYWGLTPAGEIHKQSEPGLNPYTHKPLLPASREYLALVRARLSEPLRSVSPATNEWFDVNMGWPLLWYHRTSQGELEFYKRPAVHPRYQVELQEVTVEVFQEWERAQSHHLAEVAEREAQKFDQQHKQDAARAVEQERILEIERLRLATEQQKAENARRQEAEALALKAQRIAEAAAEQAREERAATESRHQQEVANRRAREAAAEVSALDWLVPAEMLEQVCPKLNAESFQLNVFEDEYAGRRFRYSGRVARLQKDKRLATFEPLRVGEVHIIVQAALKPEIRGQLRAQRETTVAGTVAALRFVAGYTNINGLKGKLCILELGNTTGYAREAAPPSKPVVRAPRNSEPLFVPMASFSDNGPSPAVLGFALENGTRLVFAPLRLLGRHPQPNPVCAVGEPPSGSPHPIRIPAAHPPEAPVAMWSHPVANQPVQGRAVAAVGPQPHFGRPSPLGACPQNREVRTAGERRAR